MPKNTIMPVIGLLFLASQPVTASSLTLQMNNKVTAPQVRQVIKVTESQNGQTTTQEFSTSDDEQNEDSESLEQVREQMEIRRELMKKNVEESTTKRATIEAKLRTRTNELEQKLEQRRETIRERFASQSAQMSENALQHMSIVAQRVQELHDLAEKQKALGPEVREIARAQQENQASTAAQLRKIEKRNRLLKWLLGTDQKSMAQLEALQSQNEAQITALQTVLETTKDPTAKEVIENMITALEEQNLLVAQQVQTENRTFSLYGWIKNLWRR